MHAHDQSSIFSTGGKFRPDYGLLLELHALTLVARSYALLLTRMPLPTSGCKLKLNFKCTVGLNQSMGKVSGSLNAWWTWHICKF